VRAHVTILFALLAVFVSAQPVIHIWHGTDRPDDVTLTAYLPEHPSGTAVIICPGGSYFWLDAKHEGAEVALALNRHGITAFVLDYHVSGVPAFIFHCGKPVYPVVMEDVRRSFQLVRANAKTWSILPDRVGVMGFSAGGHLALWAATDTLSHPAFAAAIYPVVTMTEQCVHKRSRRGLLTDRRDAAVCEMLSMERQAQKMHCPIYLLACDDDHIVNPENAALMDAALTQVGREHRFLRLPSGGHSFGAGNDDNLWLNDFLNYLLQLGIDLA